MDINSARQQVLSSLSHSLDLQLSADTASELRLSLNHGLITWKPHSEAIRKPADDLFWSLLETLSQHPDSIVDHSDLGTAIIPVYAGVWVERKNPDASHPTVIFGHQDGDRFSMTIYKPKERLSNSLSRFVFTPRDITSQQAAALVSKLITEPRQNNAFLEEIS